MTRTVYGIVRDHDEAERLLDDLSAAGFAAEQVSVVTGQHDDMHDHEHAHADEGLTGADERVAPPRGMAAGVLAGAVVGGSVGCVVGLIMLPTQGGGTILSFGPVLAAVFGALVGAAAGLLAGSFASIGMAPREMHHDEHADGSVIVAVRAADRAQEERASALLARHGAERVLTGAGELHAA